MRCVTHPAPAHTCSPQVGRLWTSLADYYIRRGMFEKARDVYEEGLTSVITVRDFSLIFDALSQFEESLLAAKMEQLGDEEDEAMEQEGDDGADFLLKDDGNDLDLRWGRVGAVRAAGCVHGERVLCGLCRWQLEGRWRGVWYCPHGLQA